MYLDLSEHECQVLQVLLFWVENHPMIILPTAVDRISLRGVRGRIVRRGEDDE